MRINRTASPLLLLCTTFLSAALLFGGRVSAAVIFVDNSLGSDAMDGTIAKPVSKGSGPVKTIRRGLQLVRAGDTLILAANETPYHESVALAGPRHSGFESANFTVQGNGAIIDGARDVPPNAWIEAGKGLWKFHPRRKGHYQLILVDKPVPEHAVPRNAKSFPKTPQGHWSVWKGSIYYRAIGFQEPKKQAFRFAVHGVGLSLYRVRNVEVRNLTFRHFRVDGANSHDLCSNVTLENVTLIGNGRTGLFVGGSSEVVAQKCRIEGNRKNQVLIRALGAAQLKDCQVSQPPVVID